MTKQVVLLLTLSTLLFSCQSKDEYVVEGTIKGADGKNIILQKQDETTGMMVSKDTAKIENGKFEFKGKAEEPAIYLLAIDGEKAKSFLVLENGEINIDIVKDSVHLNKITGTYNNDQLTEYNGKAMVIQNKVKDFEKANAAKMQQAKATNDTVVINQLMAQHTTLRTSSGNEMMKMTDEYIKSHPKSFISALLIQSYFNSYTPDLEKIESMYKNLDASLKNTSTGKTIAKKLAEKKTVNVGQRAPEFAAPNPDGKTVSLRESMGKVTIIDFWASWCPPCRAENPNVVALYNEMHTKGLNIISVSLDKPGDAARWKDAIAKDQLTWAQVSNLKHWQDPIAKMYGVETIPATFILNQQGVVIAKDLRGAELKAKIAELLAQTAPPQVQ